jgi:hypothetical protein
MPNNRRGAKLVRKRKTQKKYRHKTKTNGMKKYNKISRRRGGQVIDKFKRTFGINRFTSRSILPKCNGVKAFTPNPAGDAKNYFLDTYENLDDFLASDTNNVITNLLHNGKDKDRLIAADLINDCNTLRKYLLFWNQKKYEIIDWYKLKSPSFVASGSKSRLTDFIIKMHRGEEPLSEELEKFWNNMDSTPEPVVEQEPVV